MNNILNGTEAFAALMTGRNILCRAVGELIDFDDLDQFPATVFAKSGYEFCIKIETIEVAGITFTKPLTLDEIQEGQDVFSITTHNPGIYISEFGRMTTAALIHSINSGFAQRDEENAKLQLQAMSKVVGHELTGDCLVVRLGDNKPKKRTTTKKADTDDVAVKTEPSLIDQIKKDIDAAKDQDDLSQVSNKILANSRKLSSEDLTALQSSFEEREVQLTESCNDQNYTSDDVEKKTTDKPEIWKTSAQEAHETLKETREMAEALMNPKLVSEEPIETDAVKLVEKFTALINEAETVDAVMQIRYQLSANGYMVRGQIIELNKLGEKRIAALTDSVDEDGDLKINGIGQQVEDYHEHKERLDVLLNDVALAQTPTEANALLKYTKHWTVEQRTPVIQAINKRLVELNPIAEIKIEETPPLMTQIQNASDLTALDVLEIDVGSRHPDIQPKLMSCVTKRRFELENGINPLEASV